MQTSRLPHLTLPIARSFVAVAAAIYLYDLFQQTRDHFTNGMGRPFGDDFINFWSGAYLAVHGHAAEDYDPAAFHAFQRTIAGAQLEGYLYIYPPVLLVLTPPLGFVPYIPALVLWLSAGWFVFYRALPLALPGGGALLLALATPAVFINTIAGQNGTWTAALSAASWPPQPPSNARRRVARIAGLQAAAWNFDSGGTCRGTTLASAGRRRHNGCSVACRQRVVVRHRHLDRLHPARRTAAAVDPGGRDWRLVPLCIGICRRSTVGCSGRNDLSRSRNCDCARRYRGGAGLVP